MQTFKINYTPYTFDFHFPGGTSRGVLTQKQSWFVSIYNSNNPKVKGMGEVSILPNLSPETPEQVKNILKRISNNPERFIHDLPNTLKGYPAVKFALETALLDLETGGKQRLFPSKFTKGQEGIRINGLIWMGEKSLMLQRIKEKLDLGFSCLKLKVGAINFEEELDLLKSIRNTFTPNTLELRVDANGAFSPKNGLAKISELSKYQIHSIEQPIKQGQWNEMAKLCNNTSIPIALDEELIGIESKEEQKRMLNIIKPQYVIFKPSLIGGFKATKQLSTIADNMNIKWWVTSALEGNIGLNAIAQWTFQHGSNMPQGLGTGQVFSNNIESPLYIKGESLKFNPDVNFNL